MPVAEKAKPVVRQGRKASDLRIYRKRLVCEKAQSKRLSYIKTAGLPEMGGPAVFFVTRQIVTEIFRSVKAQL
jgi:hypothetical protein